MKNYILWNNQNAPEIDKEKYIWVKNGVYKIWNGIDWEAISTDPGKIDPSVLPEDVVYQDDLQKLNEIDEIKAQIPKIFIIYTNIPNGNLTVGKPYGGTYNANTGELVGEIKSTLSNGMTVYWSTENQWIEDEFSYYAIGTFASSGYIIGDWSDPIPIVIGRDGKDGKDGRDGVDGVNIEFIYKRVESLEEFNSLITPYSDPEESRYVPDGWEDHPLGVNTRYIIEAVCSRNLDKDTQLWGTFSAPVMWSMYGKIGKDGDGVEYIFRTATEGEYTKTEDGIYKLDASLYPPISGDDLLSVLPVAINPTLTEQELLNLYQTSKFVPGGTEMNRFGWNRGWSDDPFSINKNIPLQFCSQRKYDGETEKWGYFTEPVLWSKADYADNSMFTAFAFAKSNIDLSQYIPEGGSGSNPIPNPMILDNNMQIVWYDSVPAGVGDVWMTRRTFGIEELESEGWSYPKKMSDSSFMQVEYSNDYPWETQPVLPNLNISDFQDPSSEEGIDEEKWRRYCADPDHEGHFYGNWTDYLQNPTFMATCKKVNGVWSDWVVSKVKGEKGDPGVDGGQSKAIRVTVWEPGKVYYNGRELDSNGNLYLDICTISPIGHTNEEGIDIDENGNEIIYYKCNTKHTSSNAQGYTLGGPFWTRLDEVGPIHSPLILAKNIKANFIDVDDLAADNTFTTNLVANEGFIEQLKAKDITTETITVEHKDDGIVTQITKLGDRTSNYPIWSGGTNVLDSKFSVDYEGNIKAIGGNIGGINISSSGLGTALIVDPTETEPQAALYITKDHFELGSYWNATSENKKSVKSIVMNADHHSSEPLLLLSTYDDDTDMVSIGPVLKIIADGDGYDNTSYHHGYAIDATGYCMFRTGASIFNKILLNGRTVFNEYTLTDTSYILKNCNLVHVFTDIENWINLPTDMYQNGDVYLIVKSSATILHIIIPNSHHDGIWLNGTGKFKNTTLQFSGQGGILITYPSTGFTSNTQVNAIITTFGGIQYSGEG